MKVLVACEESYEKEGQRMTDRKAIKMLKSFLLITSLLEIEDEEEKEEIEETFQTAISALEERQERKKGAGWTSVRDGLPKRFVSVLGHMTDAAPFPSVREGYRTGENIFFFPALNEIHPVDYWMPLPKQPKGDE